MPTRTKLVILELVSGVFGWGWLIAGGFAIFFLVMAIGFGGSWVSFVVALVIGGVSKWLAKGFEDNKQRVAYEADLVAKGMSQKEVGRAWMKAYSGELAPETAAGDVERRSMTEENRRKADERMQIVSDYGQYLEQNPTVSEIWDVTFLPHGKDAILDAIGLEIVREGDDQRVEALKVIALSLADFQESVGDKPLSALGVDISKANPGSMSADDIKALAGQIAGNPDRERYEELQVAVEQDQKNILTKLIAAEKLRDEMPEDKKREILG